MAFRKSSKIVSFDGCIDPWTQLGLKYLECWNYVILQEIKKPIFFHIIFNVLVPPRFRLYYRSPSLFLQPTFEGRLVVRLWHQIFLCRSFTRSRHKLTYFNFYYYHKLLIIYHLLINNRYISP